jgi:hypothetical protein
MELRDTINLMTSADYKERFIAEYAQAEIRRRKLRTMLQKWERGELDFTPTCPIGVLGAQLAAMQEYVISLEKRAIIEKIELPAIE